MYVIRVLADASTGTEPIYKTWVKSFDPDFQPKGYKGPKTGYIETTVIRSEAMKFETMAIAHQLYMTKSSKVPVRPDGKPNRPMTAFTVVIEEENESREI